MKSNKTTIQLIDADDFARHAPQARKDSFVVLLITRKEIEDCNYTSSLERLMVMTDTKEAVADYKESLAIQVTGYDDDKRELAEIPEVRRFFAKLSAEWPHWLWFLFRPNGGVSLLLSLLCPVRVHRSGGNFGIEFVNQDVLDATLLDLIRRSSHLFEMHDFDVDEFDEAMRGALDSLGV